MADSASASQRSRSSRSAGAVILAAVLDVVLVLAFVLIGRGSHGENVIGGALVTFWPFAAGLVIGWLISLAWRRPTALWPTGVVVWASTLVIGMLLRVVSGQGIAVSFVIVAAVVLAVFLIGWRAIALLVTSLRRRRAAGAVPADGASR
ncbi:MAG: DUF3054 domain-containing protein [Humibacter sp.]